MYTVTITKSGQITLPKELRDFLGVELGGRVTFHKTKNGVNIERKMTDKEFFDKLDSLKSSKTKAFIKKHEAKLAKMSISEMKNEWAKSPAGKKYLEEKYGSY